jgi:protocatechuate 3,4-dioxygenase beta subunit
MSTRRFGAAPARSRSAHNLQAVEPRRYIALESRMQSPHQRRPHSRQRRRLMLSLAALACAAPHGVYAQAALMATPAQAEGPFYPRTLPAERDGDLTRIAGHAERAKGTPLYLSGRVLARDGQPLAGAQIELWQCDALGIYHHVGESGPLDENFQGYGVVTTDADGRYAFITIRPVAYPGRPPHMHFKVRHSSARPLTTQLYVAGDNTDGDFVLGSSARGTLERLSVTLASASDREPGALAGSFDFVLNGR